MDLTNIGTIKRLCVEYGIRPSRKMGQNFLINRTILGKIIEAGELTRNDVVLEIGPGLGGLTLELAKRVGRVVAVEKDKRLVEYIKTLKHENIKTKLKIIKGDILDNQLFDCSIVRLLGDKYKVISNLPYQITSPVLWRFLREEKHKPVLMVLMVQKEVAERVVAKPGKMSLLSVLCQLYAECGVVLVVKKGNFWPMPEVDSAIIKLRLKDKNIKALKQRNLSDDLFFRLVKVGFANKRKMLKNNLMTGLGLSDGKVIDSFRQIGLASNVRAQELTVNDWLRLGELLD